MRRVRTGRSAQGQGPDRDALALFADELRAHRTARGWTQADIAAKTAYSESLIAQAETRHKSATPELARALYRVFATPGFTDDTDSAAGTPGTFGRLVARLRNMPFPASFRFFAAHEAEAVALSTLRALARARACCKPRSTPGPILATRPNTTADEVEEQVRGRMDRQAVLHQERPACPAAAGTDRRKGAAPPDSPACRNAGSACPPAPRSAAAEHHNPGVPYEAGGHTGLLGAFSVAEMGNRDAIVFVEDIADGRVFEDDATLSQVALRFKSLQSEALPQGSLARPDSESGCSNDGRTKRPELAQAEPQRQQRRQSA